MPAAAMPADVDTDKAADTVITGLCCQDVCPEKGHGTDSRMINPFKGDRLCRQLVKRLY